MITREYLRSILQYAPETGVWTWRVDRRRGGVKAGRRAGVIRSNDGRRTIGIDGKRYLSARLAWFYMTGNWPRIMDHKNRIRDDDRWENLREATDSQSLVNQNKRRTNTSGYRGVSKKRNKWRAEIAWNRQVIRLGVFESKHDAARAYNQAALKYHGEFAVLNEVQE